jgi:hypothetical protein
MAAFESYTGIVTVIENFWTDAQYPSGCVKIMSIQTRDGSAINFIVQPSTYFVNCVVIRVGDIITGFYEPSVPVPMIFPPQYRALVITRYSQIQHVVVEHFDEQLVSSDGVLQLSIANSTRISLTNRQPFTGSLENRNLVVVYGTAPHYILNTPQRIKPWQVIVLC